MATVGRVLLIIIKVLLKIIGAVIWLALGLLKLCLLLFCLVARLVLAFVRVGTP